ncbi:hypothetical protein R3P38DRAFT_3238601 [Favolaschia claudopus]|uniref:Uncharacterized protein n=1 Tax=Favolaschia claudopus TaxID=2862362 RepID=A0AAV9ZA41_9AGAR
MGDGVSNTTTTTAGNVGYQRLEGAAGNGKLNGEDGGIMHYGQPWLPGRGTPNTADIEGITDIAGNAVLAPEDETLALVTPSNGCVVTVVADFKANTAPYVMKCYVPDPTSWSIYDYDFPHADQSFLLYSPIDDNYSDKVSGIDLAGRGKYLVLRNRTLKSLGSAVLSAWESRARDSPEFVSEAAGAEDNKQDQEGMAGPSRGALVRADSSSAEATGRGSSKRKAAPASAPDADADAPLIKKQRLVAHGNAHDLPFMVNSDEWSDPEVTVLN